jgi:UrcA family protein
MTNFASKIAGVATLALAVLPVAALSTAAHAATPVKVAVSDLDLSTQAGQRAFDARVAKAGVQLCREEGTLRGRDVCEGAVRAEAREKLAQYMAGKSAPTAVAAVR